MRLYYTPEKCKWVVGWEKLYENGVYVRGADLLNRLWTEDHRDIRIPSVFSFQPMNFIRAVCNASSGG